MTSELQHLKQKIRRLEAGGEPNLALRREYNAKLQAHRDRAAHLSGGGIKEFKEKVLKKLHRVTDLEERVKGLQIDVKTLDENAQGDRSKLNKLEKSLTNMVETQREMVSQIPRIIHE